MHPAKRPLSSRLSRRLVVIGSLVLFASCRLFDTDRPDPKPIPPPLLPDSTAFQPLVIEEIATGNADFLDERGEDPGWVEIANIGDTAVNLGAWQMRGSAGDGPAWRLPDTLLAPGGRLLIFFSGLDSRRSAPAGDTLRAFQYKANIWSDSMNNPPGRSSIVPWEVPGRIRGPLLPDSLPALSAVLNLRDPDGTGLDWSSVELSMPMPGGALDASGRDRLQLRATIPEGQPMVVRFCEVNQECWKGSTLQIMGTGRRLDTYDVSLHGSPADLSRLTSIYFVPPTGRFGAYYLTLVDFRFYRSALRPHASFELHRKGGTLHLEDTAGFQRQAVEYPEMPATASWARVPETHTYVLRQTPSPEAPNPSDTPTVLPPSPVFLTSLAQSDKPLVIRFAATPGALVRCAEGGEVPGPASPSAAEGFRLDSTQALSCAAFDSAGHSGPVVSRFFLVGEKPALPVVSIIVDPVAMFDSVSGLYMEGPNASPAYPHYGANYWEDTELPATVEFHEKDGRRAFSENAGVGIFGNWSRAEPKRPLSVQFREKYGARRIEWPLFPQHAEFKRFKGFGLRNMGGDYSSGLSRDAVGTSLADGRDLEYQLSRHVSVYLNGRYWGIYDMREKLDADYLDTRFGLSSDGVDLLKNGGEVQAGTASAWNDMVAWFLQADLSDSAALARAAEMLDLDNMATYLAAEIWASNSDWPANNLRSWRRTSPASPWRMMLFDLDAGLGGFGGERDMFAFLGDSTVTADYPNGPRSTVFFRKLSRNPTWRARFVNRLSVLLATNFTPKRAVAVLDSMQAAHGKEKERDRLRWDLSESEQNAADADLRSFLERRPEAVLSQMRAWYGLGEPVQVVLAAEGGKVAIEGFDLGKAYRGTHFEGVPIRIQAKTAGTSFIGWSDGELSPERVITPGPEGVDLVARFK